MNEAALIRAISRFIRQSGTPHSQHYMWSTFGRHPHCARDLIALFRARFDPDRPDEQAATVATASIEAALEKVESRDEDTFIRRFASVIGAMLRTNFFQLDGDGRPRIEISFKLDSRKVEGLPEPRPFREIFVHSPRLEGVHLRFGTVARGGLRWSDRPLDFRTEILGLVKAQQVKNAVIVPVGAKGGFVPQQLPEGGSREAIVAEGTTAYRIFVSSLLDLTDNLDGDRVIPPERVVRHDDDDPYLVVAADKGTATFSDIANGIAADHDFWLGDAFASGGSAGYDHKQMGITARGAWEAVKRHFREMDTDIQTTPFTVVGVGDMSGDVFGNGMLLSPEIRLVAAFDHRDIFIDPDPRPAVALAERRRLFELPRSSWQDYDAKKISAGGGVFSRRQKSIRLTREIKALLEVSADRLTPSDLIRAILTAKADLLWFGGIGTYVRASDERDSDVGDRANDGVRIDAGALRVAVVGEGANLGMTQRARIEFGLGGGRCNSDAIDNSAGVNTSDVEVNIKIAFRRALRSGKLDRARRDRLLKAMTDSVAALVLRNNDLQTLAISLTHRRGFEDFPFQHRMMRNLEARGVLDREVETLPDDVEMIERQKAGRPLTRAEIGVLLAYAKIDLSNELVASDVIDDPALAPELMLYFPERMRKDYAGEIRSHRLSREIVATELANSMINRCGPAFVARTADRTGAGAAAIARGYVAVREAFALRALNAAIDKLDNKIAGATQLALYGAVQNLFIGRTVWFLRHVSFAEGIGKVAETYAAAVSAIGKDVMAMLPERLAGRVAERAASHSASGVPDELALRIAGLPIIASAPDIHLAATESGRPLADAAALYFKVAETMRVDRVAALAVALPVTDYYDGLALDRALDVLASAHRRIVIGTLAHSGKDDPLGEWLSSRKPAADHALNAIATMTESEELTVSRVSVAANLLADLAQG
jgi:glutamate dehydrogenase